LRVDKGNKPIGVKETARRLRRFFRGHLDVPLVTLTAKQCGELYDRLQEPDEEGRTFAVDSHRNMLAQAKSLLKWCVDKRWIRENPLAVVEGKGRRRHGKRQLRIDEARKWTTVACGLAENGDTGAVGAMLALFCGLRAGEIIGRTVRDLDGEGRLLWIEDTKTEAGRRQVEVPDFMVGYLTALAKGKGASDLLFGQHWRDWPRCNVERICRLAGVPTVCAHSMRGLHSTLAVERGMTGHVVASAMGHESFTTTATSYAKPEAVRQATQRKAWRVLEGGRR
jgi:integrase